jgi:hypothetical protein
MGVSYAARGTSVRQLSSAWYDCRVRGFPRYAVILAAVVGLSLVASSRVGSAPVVKRIWFSPGPGTLDYLRLFEHPEEWPRARGVISVFKFYAQHTQTPAPSIVGPNSYDALVRAGAFKQLRTWKIKTAIEAGSVKEFWCTPDASGMEASVRSTLDAVRAIDAGGGAVDYVAMDEPWVSGRARACGGPALEPTADRVAFYMSSVGRAYPSLKIGLIEAYPFSSAEAIESMVQMLRARGVSPAFLHMDVDWHALEPGAFARDMRRLQAFAAAQKIPFGIILVGYNGEADPLYALDAAGMANLIAGTFADWNAMPEHLIVQSWVVTATGLFITPSNLPEDRLYTHTNLVWQLFRRLRGATGGNTGVAVPRGSK